SNFFSGLMLHITRPFALHDQVELPQRKVVGYIEDIGWCLTVLRDVHKRPIYLPNSVFSQEILINVSRITHRFIEETIRWRYTDSKEVALAVEEMRQLVDTHSDIDHELPVYVFLKTITTTYAEIEIKAYIRRVAYDQFMAVKQDILLRAAEIVRERSPAIPSQ
ncbi:MAG: mechanosensitive ion channel family protein, partial [Chlamydiales bacterium]|nr:mechanosensitive ion channel family protein [Chlamydiales bacterium]